MNGWVIPLRPSIFMLWNIIRVFLSATKIAQPYEASILNISAMSFGSLSGNAVEALNRNQITRRVFMNEVKTLEEIYPTVPLGAMLNDGIPEQYKMSFQAAHADKF